MSYGTDDLPEGPRILGHAIGHAAFLYGDEIGDYEPLLRAALHGRHRAPATTRSIMSDYVVLRARQLIAQADSRQLSRDAMAMSEWIGAAAEILRELIRDA